jgi:hypothetical protein
MNIIGKDKAAALEVCDSAQPLPVNSGTPTMLGMAASFAGSMVKFAASGFKLLDEQSHELRVSECITCPYRKENRCTFCGCFFAKKARLPHEDCPVGRWPI